MLVQKLRVQRGWSQDPLAEMSGVSVRTVQRIERGHRASPESLKAIAAVFEIDFARLQEAEMSPTEHPETQSDEAWALTRVRKKKEFFVHLAQFVVVMPILAVMNVMTTPGTLWILWVLFGWGLALALHGLAVWQKFSFLDGEWERREVEKILGRRL